MAVTIHSDFGAQENKGFPGRSVAKNLPANAGEEGLNPGSGRSPGEGNGNPLQYSCLENSIDRGAWRAIVHGVSKNRPRPSMHTPGVTVWLEIIHAKCTT